MQIHRYDLIVIIFDIKRRTMGYHFPRLILLSILVTILQCKGLGIGAMSIDPLNKYPSANVIDQLKGTQFRDGIYDEEIKHEGKCNDIALKRIVSESYILIDK